MKTTHPVKRRYFIHHNGDRYYILIEGNKREARVHFIKTGQEFLSCYSYKNIEKSFREIFPEELALIL